MLEHVCSFRFIAKTHSIQQIGTFAKAISGTLSFFCVFLQRANEGIETVHTEREWARFNSNRVQEVKKTTFSNRIWWVFSTQTRTNRNQFVRNIVSAILFHFRVNIRRVFCNLYGMYVSRRIDSVRCEL